MDYDSIMRDHLVRVFGEQDAARRLAAISALYGEDATLYEPESAATGHQAINRAVGTLLGSLPPSFVFAALGPAVGHHDVGRLRWRSGPLDGPPAVTGTDVARFQDGRIQTLHVFLDPTGT